MREQWERWKDDNERLYVWIVRVIAWGVVLFGICAAVAYVLRFLGER